MSDSETPALTDLQRAAIVQYTKAHAQLRIASEKVAAAEADVCDIVPDLDLHLPLYVTIGLDDFIIQQDRSVVHLRGPPIKAP